jgi:hypothetical protein
MPDPPSQQNERKVMLMLKAGAAPFLIPFMVISLLSLPGCWTQKDFSVERYRNVERILMHEPNKYSFIFKYDEAKEYSLVTVNVWGVPKIIPDVTNGEKCWVEVGAPWVQNESFRISLTIHVHSAADINGAGWNHGKFGRGQTTVVE